MEIKLNKDLQQCTDTIAMGLNFRQAVFGGIGLILSAGAYFLSMKVWGWHQEAASWLCILIGAPFAALGFITYNGMSFERLVLTWLKFFYLCPHKLVCRLENALYPLDQQKISKMEELEAKRID